MLNLLIAIVIGAVLASGAGYAAATLLNAKPDNASLYSYGGD
jgi:hypothetical protein